MSAGLFPRPIVTRKEPLGPSGWRYWLDTGLFVDRQIEASDRTHGYLYEAFDPHVQDRYVAGHESLHGLLGLLAGIHHDGREGPD